MISVTFISPIIEHAFIFSEYFHCTMFKLQHYTPPDRAGHIVAIRFSAENVIKYINN